MSDSARSKPTDKQPAPKSETRKIVAICLVAATCLFLGIQYALLVQPAAAREIQAACTGLRPSATNPAFDRLPTQTPVDFTVQNHAGEQVKLSDYRGQVVFVNFWATWCNVCKAEKPGLERMALELEAEYDDFHVLTLASDPSWGPIRERYPDGSPLSIMLDPPAGDDTLGAVAKRFGIKAVPESFVIDRDGTIRYYFINKRDWDSNIAETCLRAVIEGET
ncbi:TlpA family protein disulfide reductase [Haliangium sp.]|uniref:TlpA family protein disulfide reductase n=1 Tax=Haliangium sp. TaxID=2663208 RepID=UPI003D11B43A